MSFVARLFNSSRFVRASNLSCYKSSPRVEYSTHFGYVSIGRPKNQLAFIKYPIGGQRFYSDNAGDKQAQPIAQYDENGAEIIYTGKFQSRIVRVKFFSLSTSLMGLAAQPLLLEKGMEMGGPGLATFLCSLAGIFTFITPVLLHLISKKYVIKITHDPKTDEYVATTISFFLTKKELKFKVDDIKIPDVDRMFTTFQVGPKRIPLLVEAREFTDIHHFARFMKYDKPVSFELDADEEKVLAEKISPQKTKELANK